MSTEKPNLKKLMAEGIVVMPGAFNALVAKLIEEAGFPGVYISGAGLANGVAGLPDIGLLSMAEVVTESSYIINAVTLPCIVDIDTGFGGAKDAAKVVSELERAGAGGVQIEDQESPKRCGHLSGKTLVSQAEMCEKISAATEARKDDNFLIIARTDAKAVEGTTQALKRAKMYADAGADCIFPEALSSKDEFALFKNELPVPLMANMTEFGKTPYISVKEFSDMGVSIVIFPLTIMRVMLKAVRSSLKMLKDEGTQTGFIDAMLDRKELYTLLDYDYLEEVDKGNGDAE